MPLFNKDKPKAPPTATTSPTPQEAMPEAAAPDVIPVSAEESGTGEVGRKARLLARFKKPQRPHLPGRQKSPQHSTDLSSAIDKLSVDANVQHSVPPVDSAKLARRAARRKERTLREQEWAEEQNKREKDSILTNVPMEPQKPLSDFDSASEDEKSVATATPPPVLAEGVDHIPESRGPFIPKNSPSQHPNLDVHSPSPIVPNQDELPAHLPDLSAPSESNMAELFAAQAFSGTLHTQPAPPQQPTQPSTAPFVHQQPIESHPPPAQNPTPIGWGGVYSGVISQPFHGLPPHLTARSMNPVDVDPMLADKIRRGRELATLAIQQEEQGNLGAAEAGYMKALGLLIPASKELTVGSDRTHVSRMKQKEKIQREAAIMLDRCEELRLFLKANGPSVPQELPTLPNSRPEPSRDREAPDPDPVQMQPPLDKLASTQKLLEQSNEDLKQTSSKPAHVARPPIPKMGRLPPPPPAPPAFDEGNDDELLNRMAIRKNVLNSTQLPRSVANFMQIPSGKLTSAQFEAAAESIRRIPNAKCFMCNAPAEVATPCDHTFCTNCGNQAVAVFGRCPVPGCGAEISKETFQRITT